MRRLVLLGAGGHAKVIADILFDRGDEVVACISADDSALEYRGISVIVGDSRLAEFADQIDGVVPAVGSNSLREQLAEFARSLGFSVQSAISANALISPTATIGDGAVVMAGAVINADAVIGDLAIVNTLASIDHDCVLGVATHIGPGSSLAGHVTVGARSFLGVGTKVIPGIEIGQDSIVGAGSVVVRDIAAGVTAFGAPARVHETQKGRL